jgi:hypothetical protein
MRHVVVLCALLSAAARFVPIPFVDDIVRERVRQALVGQLLRINGRSFGTGRVQPLWRDPEGCAGGCLTLLWKLPLTILLFPIRKIVALIKAVRGFGSDVTLSLLFGRAVSRALELGLLSDGAPDAELASQSLAVRRAFDVAQARTDTVLLGAALTEALRSVSGLMAAARKAARRLARSGPDPEAPTAGDAVLEQGVGVVEAVLARPDIARALADFDARFANALRQPPAT